MNEPLYSVRMRASRQGEHVSGAERIVIASELDRVASGLIARAMRHERGVPDSVTVTLDALEVSDIEYMPPLPVTSRNTGSPAAAHELAVKELIRAGVSENAAKSALSSITAVSHGKDGKMGGAMIMDAASGERLEPDMSRGIRARCVDYEETGLKELTAALKARGLDKTHLKEALALATKVAGAPGAVAELCISDDPSYVTGYVASPNFGYVRITPMKEPGGRMGGRAFFVDRAAFDMGSYVAYMRETPVLIKGNLELL